MPMNYDAHWRVGEVRVRASAPDPYAGLRGKDYIVARGLNQSTITRLDAGTAQVPHFLFSTGSSDYLPKRGRRFVLVEGEERIK